MKFLQTARVGLHDPEGPFMIHSLHLDGELIYFLKKERVCVFVL